jgi:hypothetical protein
MPRLDTTDPDVVPVDGDDDSTAPDATDTIVGARVWHHPREYAMAPGSFTAGVVRALEDDTALVEPFDRPGEKVAIAVAELAALHPDESLEGSR